MSQSHPSGHLDAQDGDPVWKFGDLPIGSTDIVAGFQNDVRGVKTGRSNVDSAPGARNHVKWDTVTPDAPVSTFTLPEVEALRKKYAYFLQKAPEFNEFNPAAYVLACEKEALAERENAANAIENNGMVYGPSHNPSDRLREKTAWEDVPSDAFFTTTTEPNPLDMVFVKEGNSIQAVCRFGEWQSSIRNAHIIPLEKDRRELEAMAKKKLTPEAIVTVLSALSPEEFDYVRAQRDLGRKEPVSAGQRAFMEELRDKLVAFWEKVNKGKKPE